MRFGVCEYTLVFRRAIGHRGREARSWDIVRPSQHRQRAKGSPADGLAELFVVPICSTLAFDELVYEQFLNQSGVLADALRHLALLSLADAESVETVRRQIQSLIMKAEVDFIVSGMMKGA